MGILADSVRAATGLMSGGLDPRSAQKEKVYGPCPGGTRPAMEGHGEGMGQGGDDLKVS